MAHPRLTTAEWQRATEIRTTRATLGLTQGTVAAAVGISRQTLNHYEMCMSLMPLERYESIMRALAELPARRPPPSRYRIIRDRNGGARGTVRSTHG